MSYFVMQVNGKIRQVLVSNVIFSLLVVLTAHLFSTEQSGHPEIIS